MADISLDRMTVGFRSISPAALERLRDALKSGKGKGVKQIPAYAEEHKGKIDYAEKSITLEADTWDVSVFFPLIPAHPRISFGFDFEFSGATAAGSGRGRYFCLYESGKKVFDASCWLEEAAFLNMWLIQNIVDGDFYAMDIEAAHQAAAKALLHQRGKKETKKAVEEVVASFPDNGDDTECFRDNLCFEDIALVGGGWSYGWEKNFHDWSRVHRTNPQDIYDEGACQDAYELFQIA